MISVFVYPNVRINSKPPNVLIKKFKKISLPKK